MEVFPVRIFFTLGDRRYVAVGFHRGSEHMYESVPIQDKLDYASQEGGTVPVGEDDWIFLSAMVRDFPRELNGCNLLTDRHDPEYSDCLSHFVLTRSRGWCEGTELLHLGYDNDLVIRRCL